MVKHTKEKKFLFHQDTVSQNNTPTSQSRKGTLDKLEQKVLSMVLPKKLIPNYLKLHNYLLGFMNTYMIKC